MSRFSRPLFFLFVLICGPASANAGGSEAAIFDAAAKGDGAEVRRLVSENSSLLHARDSAQRTPLHAAAEAGELEAVRALIEAGAEPSARDGKGCTPLHRAAWKGHKAVAEFLLGYGADIEAADVFGRTPLSWALLAGRSETTAFLRSRMSRLDIFSACRLGERDAVKARLREDPAVLNRADGSGNTPLHWAVLGWQPKTVELLVSRGADLSARNAEGETALMMAERMGEFESLAAMHRVLGRRQRQAWAWAFAMAGAIAGVPFWAGRRRKRMGNGRCIEDDGC